MPESAAPIDRLKDSRQVVVRIGELGVESHGGAVGADRVFEPPSPWCMTPQLNQAKALSGSKLTACR